MGGGISLNPRSLDLISVDKVINPAQLIHLKDINPDVDEKTIREAYAQFQRHNRLKGIETDIMESRFNTLRKDAMDDAWAKANMIKLSYYAGDTQKMSIQGVFYDDGTGAELDRLEYPPETRDVIPDFVFQTGENTYEIHIPASKATRIGFREAIPVFITQFFHWINTLRNNNDTWTREHYKRPYHDASSSLFKTLVSLWNTQVIASDYLFFKNKVYENFRLVDYIHTPYYFGLSTSTWDAEDYECEIFTLCAVTCVSARGEQAHLSGTYICFTTNVSTPIYCAFLQGHTIDDRGGARFMELETNDTCIYLTFLTDELGGWQTDDGETIQGVLSVRVTNTVPTVRWETNWTSHALEDGGEYVTTSVINIQVQALQDVIGNNDFVRTILHPSMAANWEEYHYTQSVPLQKEMTTAFLASGTCSLQ